MGKLYIGTADGIKEMSSVAPHGEQIFTESGTFTVPDGVYNISVFLVGGGASSGFYRSTSNSSALGVSLGGADGCTKIINSIPVTPGDEHTIKIGSGGAPNSEFTYFIYSNSNITRGKSYNGNGGGATCFDDYVAKGGGCSYHNGTSVIATGVKPCIYKTIYEASNGGISNPQAATPNSKIISDSDYAFGLYTNTKYCNGENAGSGADPDPTLSYESNWGCSSRAGKDGICIIRW